MKCHLKYYILLKEEIIHNWFIQQKRETQMCFPFFMPALVHGQNFWY